MVDTKIINLKDFYEDKDYNKTFQLLDGDTPVDITGYSWKFVARLPESDTNAIEQSMTITSASDGLFSLNLDPSTTSSLSVNRVYVYQIQGTTADGEEFVYVEGEFEVKESY